MNKRVTMAAKPSRKTAPADVDDFVNAGAEQVAAAPAPAADPVKMKRLTIDIDADLHRRLKVACAASGEKMADFVRELIARHVP